VHSVQARRLPTSLASVYATAMLPPELPGEPCSSARIMLAKARARLWHMLVDVLAVNTVLHHVTSDSGQCLRRGASCSVQDRVQPQDPALIGIASLPGCSLQLTEALPALR